MKLTSTIRATSLAVAACCLLSHLSGVDAFANSGRAGFMAPAKATRSIDDMPISTKLSASSSGIVEGIGEEGCSLPSVSGWNTKDDLTQAFVVKAVFLSLGAGTYLFSSGLHELSTLMGSNFDFFRSTWPLALGAVFSLAGVTHFTLSEEYENIVPTKGSWGVWNIPGSKKFHVAWTGVAELAGGLGLLGGGLSSIFGDSTLAPLTSAGLESDAAAALFVLTLAVTPANIFMYTHGAKLPMDSDPLPLNFHAIRWVMQVVLLGFLYQMGEGTFQVLFS
mmetsp:Transcript_20660/g.51311  ORF Transcript_20660/g.51311 Transcript_20660/m.51311 type:complete len:278 (-) Transcript_20660:169-1002(-)|eukprot:CAMPEP_0116100452 /NCGR_PEP_ID=MMETSP0327-20121206/12297_1 /TAXON_ID=44447 /ORGANISM="Pseudo-nitzschia delicatissima, Strain B596" /LENGTH=277 /DNA_ID=CAMNT_0003592373 /DNA_START=111 /DNA_END=944 /DNA_ORIENTATION=-